MSSDRAELTFGSVGPGGLVTCAAAGLELLVTSQLNSSWVPALIVFQSGDDRLTLQAPDGASGCEQTLSAVRFRHHCPALRSWNHKTSAGPCIPLTTNCSVYDGLGRPLHPFEMNLTTARGGGSTAHQFMQRLVPRSRRGNGTIPQNLSDA